MVQPLLVAATAQLLEAAFGYPDPLYRLLRHPVNGLGLLIERADRLLNRDGADRRVRRLAGLLALLPMIGGPTLCALLARRAAFAALPPRLVIAASGVLAASLPAQRSLHAHVLAVARALERDGLGAGRRAVAMIVGRDTAALDEPAVARAAIESLAENFSDGVVAPLLWCACFGLPGIVFYKAVNTADSMIGHRTPRHEAFGWAAARLDDLVNLPASRLAALMLALSAPRRAGAALRTMQRDAGAHRSPNAGWPEAAMAGALGVRLSGPRRYHGRLVHEPWLGDGRERCDAGDIRAALRLYRRACALGGALLLAALGLAASRRRR